MNKIILVYYINVSGKSTQKAKQVLEELNRQLIKSDDILNFISPKSFIHLIIYPNFPRVEAITNGAYVKI